MNRTTWLQDLRMQKFRDGLSRWERNKLSGEILGMSERQFRRYRRRYEEDGFKASSGNRARARQTYHPVMEAGLVGPNGKGCVELPRGGCSCCISRHFGC
jgi:hypothetical protein